jgi:eukaryotic-like serine/threonine-protein kinase
MATDGRIPTSRTSPPSRNSLSSDWQQPVIIDLGLSRLLDLTTMTVYPWVAGTWPYMALEQLAGERAIDRTDIWALSVIAGELANGRHPF